MDITKLYWSKTSEGRLAYEYLSETQAHIRYNIINKTLLEKYKLIPITYTDGKHIRKCFTYKYDTNGMRNYASRIIIFHSFLTLIKRYKSECVLSFIRNKGEFFNKLKEHINNKNYVMIFDETYNPLNIPLEIKQLYHTLSEPNPHSRLVHPM